MQPLGQKIVNTGERPVTAQAAMQKGSAMTDSEIVNLYLSRREEAIEQSKLKYHRGLQNIANNILSSPPDAEEALNDTYFTAWKTIPPHEPRTYLFPYLARIVRCISLDICKKKSREKRSAVVLEISAEMEECLPAPDDTECKIEDDELGRLMSDFLSRQPLRQRNIFVRRYWYSDSVKELSLTFGITEGAVKSSLFHTRKKLKEYFMKKGVSL